MYMYKKSITIWLLMISAGLFRCAGGQCCVEHDASEGHSGGKQYPRIHVHTSIQWNPSRAHRLPDTSSMLIPACDIKSRKCVNAILIHYKNDKILKSVMEKRGGGYSFSDWHVKCYNVNVIWCICAIVVHFKILRHQS